MMQIVKLAAALAAAIPFATGTACAQAVLAADVIRQSLAGNTGEVGSAPNVVYVYWAADGTQRMINSRSELDGGAWRITPEGDFCGKWTRLRNGVEVCAPIIDLGGGQYQWGGSKFRILLGNAKNL
jgi:hypothetical protein